MGTSEIEFDAKSVKKEMIARHTSLSLVFRILGINYWRAKNNSNIGMCTNTNRIRVILSFKYQKNYVLPLIRNMFAKFNVVYTIYTEKNDFKAIKNIALDDLIFYDENLSSEILLACNLNLHDRCFAVKIDQLNCADVKKQTMMDLYALSDFSVK